MKQSTNLLSYMLDNDFIVAAITVQEHTYKSQHEIILADLNQYTHCAY